MARKRMITTDVIGTDKFLKLSLAARGLYMHLNAVADDDGFIASPQGTTFMVGGDQVILRELIDSGYIMEMDSGICLVTHWYMHNTLKGDRYNPTIYTEERKQVHLANKIYVRGAGADVDAAGNPVEPQRRTEKGKGDKCSGDKARAPASRCKQNAFSSHEQQTYDFEQLEKELLAN